MLRELSLSIFSNAELLGILIVCGIICAIAFFVYRKLPKEEEVIEESTKDKVYRVSKKFKKLSKVDYFWMILLTVLYAVVSLWNLGSFEKVGSYYQPVVSNEHVILELGEEHTFDTIVWVAGEGNNNTSESGYQNVVNFTIAGSNDLENWDYITTLDNENFLKLNLVEGFVWNYKYIDIISNDSNCVLNEIGFFKVESDQLLPVSVYTTLEEVASYNNPENLIDEQSALVKDPSYMNETYFDEIYHTRNAQEIKNGQYLYAFVHPLFGTTLISIGMSVFGVSPFGWRIMGALAGILMMPVLYMMIKTLFDKTKLSVFGTILLGVEFMHFTTSRIGTLEPFSILFIMLSYYFMFRYFFTNFYDADQKQQFKWLAASGIFMGCSIATKFTGVYAGIGLGVLFFINYLQRYFEFDDAKNNKKRITRKLSSSSKDKVLLEQANDYDMIISSFGIHTKKTGIWCIIWFIFVPLAIYFGSFIPLNIVKGEGFSIAAVWNQTMSMYNYHANLDATHPYQSVWWQWILDIRPIWYYYRNSEAGYNTISAMGNPIIYWVGAVSMLATFYYAIKDKCQTAILISVSYLAQLVPWLFVTRCVFIYHYYPSVPFMILGIVYAAKRLVQTNPKYEKAVKVFVVVAVLLFIIFLPVISGFTTTSEYVNTVCRWFGSWYFGA